MPLLRNCSHTTFKLWDFKLVNLGFLGDKFSFFGGDKFFIIHNFLKFNKTIFEASKNLPMVIFFSLGFQTTL